MTGRVTLCSGTAATLKETRASWRLIAGTHCPRRRSPERLPGSVPGGICTRHHSRLRPSAGRGTAAAAGPPAAAGTSGAAAPPPIGRRTKRGSKELDSVRVSLRKENSSGSGSRGWKETAQPGSRRASTVPPGPIRSQTPHRQDRQARSSPSRKKPGASAGSEGGTPSSAR